ncbi:MAG: hypothetical protein ACYS8Z_12750 [Planctomycetota bacterium]|jgi:hypothetical protein
MKMLTALCLLYSLLIAGCSVGPRYWYSDTRDFDQIRQDCVSCKSQADEEANWELDRHRRMERLGIDEQTAGYKRSFTDTGFRPGRAEQIAITFSICMERRGYRRVKLTDLPPAIYKQCGHAAPPGFCFAGKQP